MAKRKKSGVQSTGSTNVSETVAHFVFFYNFFETFFFNFCNYKYIIIIL